MQDDFNKDPFETNDEVNQNNNGENSQEEYSQPGATYHYRAPENNDDNTPRWAPYEEPPRKSPKPPKKSNKGWVIPLVIILVIMVIAIAIGMIFGSRQLSRMVQEANTQIAQENEQGNKDVQKPADNGTAGSPAETVNPKVSSGGLILTDVSDVVDQVMPAVVSITSRSLVDSGGYGSYWDYFFGYGPYYGNGEKTEVESGIGSGTIISQTSDELIILTSYHVVSGSSSLYVTFVDGNSVDGYIKAQSENEDIALVAVPLSEVSEDTLGSISVATLCETEAEVGEGVIVIGNAMGYGMSVTSGIVSAVNRQLQTQSGGSVTVLQTDAAINSGNSGGCVVNQYGEIIGISEAKIVVNNAEGMCYAIQVSAENDVIQMLLNGGNTATAGNDQQPAETGNGAYLGIRGRDIDRTLANSYGMPQGVYVASTIAGGGAEAAGIKEGDIIVGMDNVSFTTMNELQEQLSRHKSGDKVSLILMRETDGRYSQTKVDVVLSDQVG